MQDILIQTIKPYSTPWVSAFLNSVHLGNVLFLLISDITSSWLIPNLSFKKLSWALPTTSSAVPKWRLNAPPVPTGFVPHPVVNIHHSTMACCQHCLLYLIINPPCPNPFLHCSLTTISPMTTNKSGMVIFDDDKSGKNGSSKRRCAAMDSLMLWPYQAHEF